MWLTKRIMLSAPVPAPRLSTAADFKLRHYRDSLTVDEGWGSS